MPQLLYTDHDAFKAAVMTLDISKAADYNYCQRLYAALCNTVVVRENPSDIIAEHYVTHSWRDAAKVAAEFRSRVESVGYVDFYIAGLSVDELNAFNESCTIVEGIITDDIRVDLKSLGWMVNQRKVIWYFYL